MSSEATKEFCDELHGHFQENAEGFFIPGDEVDAELPPESGVLVSWIVVAAWQGTDGERWITYHRRRDQPIWESRGLLSEAIHDL